jgi:L-amino acid N-acyltransferase YncA
VELVGPRKAPENENGSSGGRNGRVEKPDPDKTNMRGDRIRVKGSMSGSNYELRQVRGEDRESIIEIFNYYIARSYAAYPSEKVEPDFLEQLMHGTHSFFVAELEGKVVGFAFLKPYLPISTFRSTATVTYFIDPDHRRSGLGTHILMTLESDAKKRGIQTLLAHISSRNEESISFHEKNGFSECGRFPDIGVKFGARFDVIWMAKKLAP